MYAHVFIENNYKKIDILYTYQIPEGMELEIGQRVQVSFGKGVRIGIVLQVRETYEGKFKDTIKKIDKVLDPDPIISQELIQLALWMKKRYLLGFSKAFAPVLPPGNLKVIRRQINPLQKEELDPTFLKIVKKKKYYEALSTEEQNQAKYYYDKKMIDLKYVSMTKIKMKTIKYVSVHSHLLPDQLKNLPEKQRKVYQYLQEKGPTPQKDLLMELKISNSPIQSLNKKKLVTIYDQEVYRKASSPGEKKEFHILNSEQQEAFQSIISTSKEVSLLHGLTGSGKTEVYLHLTKKVLEQKGQVIVLVPEIGLTPQMIQRFKSRFGEEVSILHSKLSPGERYDEYRRIKNNEVQIVVGVRSAVFAPFDNLQMIIIDEEHDSSYDFHNGLKYDTVEVAIKRMQDRGKVVLGSATPSVERYYKATKGIYHLATLYNRASEGAHLPMTEIVDLRQELMRGNVSIFSTLLQKRLEEKLKQKEQIILFLNRRGFSTFVSCRNCGHVIKCENCDISMTYHKAKHRLICHYCGATKPLPSSCPECGSKYIKEFGIGTQKVEEEVHKLFPGIRTLRMDRDTTVKKQSFDIFYEKIKNREVDMVIGTQMVSKGFDFPNVTLVGVIASDLSLYVSDYQATERTFQLITQVAGRAGRSKKRGHVVIQTYNPENYAIQYAAETNYLQFYQAELKERRQFSYPPFVKLIHITISSPKEEITEQWINGFYYNISKETVQMKVEATRIIPLPRIKNIYRSRFTLKVLPEDEAMLINALKRVLIRSKIVERNNVFIDIEF